MTWGLNLGTDNIQNAVNMAKSIMKTFSNGNQAGSTGVYLDLLELGAYRSLAGVFVVNTVTQATKPISSRLVVDLPTGRFKNTSPSTCQLL